MALRTELTLLRRPIGQYSEVIIPGGTVVPQTSVYTVVTGLTTTALSSDHSTDDSGITVPPGPYLITAEVLWDASDSQWPRNVAISTTNAFGTQQYYSNNSTIARSTVSLMQTYTISLVLPLSTKIQIALLAGVLASASRVIAPGNNTKLCVHRIA